MSAPDPTPPETTGQPEYAVEFDLLAEDRLPLPEQTAKQRNPIDRSYTDTYAEPREQIRIRMDYNDIDRRWMFTAAIAGRGTIIPRKPAMLFHPYEFREREFFMFIDPFFDREYVTPRNLGDPVYLTVIPGPESPGFQDWYAERQAPETRDEPPAPDDPTDRILF